MKFTRSTLKSVLKNKKCSVKVKSSFDGMTDCVVDKEYAQFIEIDKSKLNFDEKYTFGVPGLWLVGNSRDYFTMKSENEVEVWNCCGSCVIRFE